MGRRGRDAVTPKTNRQTTKKQNSQTPQVQKATIWRDHKNMKRFPQEQRACALNQAPQPLDLAQEIGAPKMPGFENQRGLRLGNNRPERKGEPVLRGSCVESLTLGPITKTQF